MTPFARRVLDVVDAIPPGRVLTYGDVAELVGSAAPRAVGMVLARHGDEVPWHRVVLASGARLPGMHRGHSCCCARRERTCGLGGSTWTGPGGTAEQDRRGIGAG
jgi:6-O-methylguanine DNA methyltransferase, DNA binding domain